MKKIFSLLILVVLAVPFISLGDMISNEKAFLREKYESSLQKCNHIKDEGEQSACINKYSSQYEMKLNLLMENPDQYFDNKYGPNIPSVGGRGRRSPITITGERDNQGNRYTPAEGGNLLRSDGTLMQKAEGGYIDTKTGEFVPAN